MQSAFLIKHKEFLNFLNNKDKEEIFKRFADEYLEKIIQIPFSIPALNEEAIENYINELLTPIDSVRESDIKSKDLYENFKKSLNVKLFTKILIEKNLNPRRIKRILNIVFLNYLFIIFKSDEEDIRKQDLDLLMLLGIIRDQYSVYYRKNLLSEILCKRTFKIMLDFIKNEQNRTELEDTNIESITENEEVNDLFNIFFKELKIKRYSELDELLNNIGNILTISHTTTSENYEELYWGEIGEIKSTTGTNKTLKVFLNRIKSNQKQIDFLLWFFNNIYDYKNYYLGIQKNVHFYRRYNNNHYDNFLFKFLYDNKNEDLFIKFESGKYESKLSYEQIFENEQSYNNDKKQVSINKNIKDLELQNIKNKLYELILLE